jgi:hypothetical protein
VVSGKGEDGYRCGERYERPPKVEGGVCRRAAAAEVSRENVATGAKLSNLANLCTRTFLFKRRTAPASRLTPDVLHSGLAKCY